MTTEDGTPKYARIERERRFLVSRSFDWRAGAEPYARRIVDRYLSCGLLRVRAMTDLDTGRVVRKLTKKYAAHGPAAQPITTIYLTADEHAALAALPGRDLTKVRHYVKLGAHVWGFDAFEGSLAGLVISELELEQADDLAALEPPPWAEREVTGDPTYACGTLALGL